MMNKQWIGFQIKMQELVNTLDDIFFLFYFLKNCITVFFIINYIIKIVFTIKDV